MDWFPIKVYEHRSSSHVLTIQVPDCMVDLTVGKWWIGRSGDPFRNAKPMYLWQYLAMYSGQHQWREDRNINIAYKLFLATGTVQEIKLIPRPRINNFFCSWCGAKTGFECPECSTPLCQKCNEGHSHNEPESAK